MLRGPPLGMKYHFDTVSELNVQQNLQPEPKEDCAPVTYAKKEQTRTTAPAECLLNHGTQCFSESFSLRNKKSKVQKFLVPDFFKKMIFRYASVQQRRIGRDIEAYMVTMVAYLLENG